MQTENGDQVTVILDFFSDMSAELLLRTSSSESQSLARIVFPMGLTASFKFWIARPWIVGNPNIFELSVKICILQYL
ncbi:uncharacterized protein BJ212DRAFT_1405745 [Suillus subaureus]|uniref:Uncharacterized protein n=1 Tax=Suillus subaureus TaxID=48587 RepID=A0A9P7DL91_9AGAM|nr:uncharacterized protein BJ212DRAFT_1405745 [Suillus subaureus]KAG1797598.1 hypothetical protein BJ212DRAFT_1405745 [Suillus subaureus]